MIRRMATSADSVRGYVFLGLSVDGRIARPDGDLEWLTSRGAAAGDAGFTPFMNSVDAVLMGRKTYEAIAFEEHWPYLDRPIHVVSTRLAADADPRITVHRSAESAVDALARSGHQRVYVDGGQTVQWFLAAGLVDELTLSHVPVLNRRRADAIRSAPRRPGPPAPPYRRPRRWDGPNHLPRSRPTRGTRSRLDATASTRSREPSRRTGFL